MVEKNILLGDTSRELRNPIIATLEQKIRQYFYGIDNFSFATSQDLRDAIGVGEENPFVDPIDLSGVDSVVLLGSELDLCIVDAVSALLKSGVQTVSIIPDLVVTHEDYLEQKRPNNIILLERFSNTLRAKLLRDGMRTEKLIINTTEDSWDFSLVN